MDRGLNRGIRELNRRIQIKAGIGTTTTKMFLLRQSRYGLSIERGRYNRTHGMAVAILRGKTFGPSVSPYCSEYIVRYMVCTS